MKSFSTPPVHSPPYILAAAPAAAPSRNPQSAIPNPQSAIRLSQLTHTIKLIIVSVKSVTQGCDGSFSTGSGRTTPCSLRSPPPRLGIFFQIRLCKIPISIRRPSGRHLPAIRNPQSAIRLPQLTHTIKLIITSVKSVTQGCDGSFSTGSGRTTPCSLRSPPPRLAGSGGL